MAPEEVEKPTEAKPEESASAKATADEPAASAEATAGEPAAANERAAAAEPAAAAEAKPPTPPADPVKQIGDAANQVGASVNTAMAGQSPQNQLLIVAIVSILVGGWLGSILNGQVMKGVAILVACVVLFGLGFFTFGLGFLLWFLAHLLAIVDAIIIANRKTKGETFAEWDFFWKPAPAA